MIETRVIVFYDLSCHVEGIASSFRYFVGYLELPDGQGFTGIVDPIYQLQDGRIIKGGTLLVVLKILLSLMEVLVVLRVYVLVYGGQAHMGWNHLPPTSYFDQLRPGLFVILI